MTGLSAGLYRPGIILWLFALLFLRATYAAPVYDEDATQVAEYQGSATGCYYNFQHYEEGDRILTNEPCLNCTCHNRMLMCYLRVCPFTKAIGQDCKVEKRPDQCCPVITCPEVPVQLLTSTTSAPSTDSTEIGFHDNYGCSIDNKFYADGAQLPTDSNNPCELCYCIRNRTTCLMQECTLKVAGCKPLYHPGICCPVKYNCDYDEEPGTTPSPTPGLIMTTTMAPGTSSPQCFHERKVYDDGDLISSTQPCQHCYCFRGDIACAVQDCGTPMQTHGKNCTALPPPEGECCPTTYECEGDSGLPEGEEQHPVILDENEIQATQAPLPAEGDGEEQKPEEIFPGADNSIPEITPPPVAQTEETPAENVTMVEGNEVPEKESSAPKETTEPSSVTESEAPVEGGEHKPEAPVIEDKISTEEGQITGDVQKPEESEEKITPRPTPTGIKPSIPARKEDQIPIEEEPEMRPEVGTAAPEEQATETSGLAQDVEEPEIQLGHIPTETPESVQETDGLEIHTEHVPTTAHIGEDNEVPKGKEPTPTESSVTLSEPEVTTGEFKEGEEKKPENGIAIEAVVTGGTVTVTSESGEISTEGPKEEAKPIEEETPIGIPEVITSAPVEEEIPVSSEQITEKPEEETSELPIEGPAGISIPPRLPEMKAEDQESVTEIHVTQGFDKTETESIAPDNLVTETPQMDPFSSKPVQPVEEQIPVDEQKPEREQKPVEPESSEAPVTESTGESEETSPGERIQKIPSPTEIAEIETPTLSGETSTEANQSTESSAEEMPTKGLEVSGETSSEETSSEIPSGTQPTSSEETSSEESSSSPAEETSSAQPSEVPSEISTESATGASVPEEQTEKLDEVSESEGPLKTTEEAPVSEAQPGASEEGTETPHAEEPVTATAETSTDVSETAATSVLTDEPSTGVSEAATTLAPTEDGKPADVTAVPELLSSEAPVAEEKPEEDGEQITQFSQIPEEPSTELKTESPEVKPEEGITPTKAPAGGEQTELSVSSEQPTQPSVSDAGEVHTTEGTIVPEDSTPTEGPIAEEKPTESLIAEEKLTESSIAEEKPTDGLIAEEKSTAGPIAEEKPTEGPFAEEKPTESPIVEEKPTEDAMAEEKSTEGPMAEEKPTEGPMTDEKSTEDAISTEKPTQSPVAEEQPTEVPIPEEKLTQVPIFEEKPIEGPATEETPMEGPIPEEDQTQLAEEPVTEIAGETGEPDKIPEVAATEAPVDEEKVMEAAISEEKPISTEPPSEASTAEQKPSEEPSTTDAPVIEEKPTEAAVSEAKPTESNEVPTAIPEQKPYQPAQTAAPEETSPEVMEVNPTEQSIEQATSAPEHKPEEGFVATPSMPVPEKPITSAPKEQTVGIPEQKMETPTEEPAKAIVPEISTETLPASEEFSEYPKEKPEIDGITEPSPSEPSSVAPEAQTKEPITVKVVTEPAEPTKPEEQVPETPEEQLTENPEETEDTPASSSVQATVDTVGEGKLGTEAPAQEQTPEEPTEMPVTLELTEKTEEGTPAPETPVDETPTPGSDEYTPPGIPGEGNCLVDGQSYNNNSAIAPSNACQMNCHCISSIVHCELVQCSPPPPHMTNCMPIHSTDACCPMYACDAAPTVSLEAENQMAGQTTLDSKEESEEPMTEAPATSTISESPVEQKTAIPTAAKTPDEPSSEGPASEPPKMAQTPEQETIKPEAPTSEALAETPVEILTEAPIIMKKSTPEREIASPTSASPEAPAEPTDPGTSVEHVTSDIDTRVQESTPVEEQQTSPPEVPKEERVTTVPEEATSEEPASHKQPTVAPEEQSHFEAPEKPSEAPEEHPTEPGMISTEGIDEPSSTEPTISEQPSTGPSTDIESSTEVSVETQPAGEKSVGETQKPAKGTEAPAEAKPEKETPAPEQPTEGLISDDQTPPPETPVETESKAPETEGQTQAPVTAEPETSTPAVEKEILKPAEETPSTEGITLAPGDVSEDLQHSSESPSPAEEPTSAPADEPTFEEQTSAPVVSEEAVTSAEETPVGMTKEGTTEQPALPKAETAKPAEEPTETPAIPTETAHPEEGIIPEKPEGPSSTEGPIDEQTSKPEVTESGEVPTGEEHTSAPVTESVTVSESEGMKPEEIPSKEKPTAAPRGEEKSTEVPSDEKKLEETPATKPDEDKMPEAKIKPEEIPTESPKSEDIPSEEKKPEEVPSEEKQPEEIFTEGKNREEPQTGQTPVEQTEGPMETAETATPVESETGKPAEVTAEPTDALVKSTQGEPATESQVNPTAQPETPTEAQTEPSAVTEAKPEEHPESTAEPKVETPVPEVQPTESSVPIEKSTEIPATDTPLAEETPSIPTEEQTSRPDESAPSVTDMETKPSAESSTDAISTELAGDVTKDATEAPLEEEKPSATPIAEEKSTETPIADEKPMEDPISEEKPTETPVEEEKPSEAPVEEEEPTEGAISEEKPTESPVEKEKPTESPVGTEKPSETPIDKEKPTKGPISEEKVTEVSMSEEKVTEGSTSEEKSTEGPGAEEKPTETPVVEEKPTQSPMEEPLTTETRLGETSEEKPTEAPAEEGKPTEGLIAEKKPSKVSISEENPTEGPVAEEKATEASAEEEKPTRGSVAEEKPTEASVEGEKPPESPLTEEQPTEVPVKLEKSTEGPTFEETPTKGPTSKEKSTEGPTSEEKSTEGPAAEEKPTETPVEEEKPTQSLMEEPVTTETHLRDTPESSKEGSPSLEEGSSPLPSGESTPSSTELPSSSSAPERPDASSTQATHLPSSSSAPAEAEKPTTEPAKHLEEPSETPTLGIVHPIESDTSAPGNAATETTAQPFETSPSGEGTTITKATPTEETQAPEIKSEQKPLEPEEELNLSPEPSESSEPSDEDQQQVQVPVFPDELEEPEVQQTVRPAEHETQEHVPPAVHPAYLPSSSTLPPHGIEEHSEQTTGEESPNFPVNAGTYLNHDEEDYDEDDQAVYGPGTCRYGGKVYVSAQQIPRDDPCDFCFCFRSDIICLQQSCPPPIPGCHEEPISGFCCPRYECHVSMATSLNVTTTTTTTTTTLPPHFLSHAYKGAARRSGCQIRGQAYRVGEVIKTASGPCLQCTCGSDGNMKCDPRVCTPEPLIRQMIAAATAKRRR